MKITLLFITILTLTFSIHANESESDNTSELYNEVLEKHLNSGHLSKQELQKQKFYHSNEKSWQKEFNNHVRGVASTIKSPREVIKFENPAIEISVK